jgi:predicted dehydrogenase
MEIQSVSPAPEDASQPVRVGVVGVGHRAEIALYVGKTGAHAELVAAADTAEVGRARARAMFGDDVAVFASHEDLIAAGGVDAVFVTTPDFTHARIAVDLLRAGIAVYLEKPMAISLEDADAILLAAYETKTPLFVGHNYRHSPVVRLMRDVIARGEIGEVKAVWCRHFVGNGGDFYFKDWHADRAKVGSLLLQKACHDIDVIHLLSGAYTTRVVGMGDLMVYGQITDRRDRSNETMEEWLSDDNWPPLTQTGLNPIVDVEDVSMMMMTLDNGVLASYEQCHFTPDYWRNYTVIGTEGRVENIGDDIGGVVKVWNRRKPYQLEGDLEYTISSESGGHIDADFDTVAEFLSHLANGTPLTISPLAARQAVAAGALAAQSLRTGSVPLDVPELPAEATEYFKSIGM